MPTIIQYFRGRNTLFWLFLTVVVVSFLMHATFRDQHFQEADSSFVYDTLTQFPSSQLRAIALFYPERATLSESQIESLLSIPLVKSAKEKYADGVPTELIVAKLTKSSPLALLRYAEVQVLALLPIPYPLQSAFALPLASTYSFLPGLLYGTATWFTDSYSGFMSAALLLTLMVFHGQIILLYFTLKKLLFSDGVSVLVSILALFSVSLYGYANHLGSTIWNIASVGIWLFLLLHWYGHRRRDHRMSYLSAVLLFANYLTVFFWLAYAIVSGREAFRSGRLKNFLLSQWSMLLSIGVVSIVLLTPGNQGFRGESSLLELPTHLYYIILNFFSWSNVELVNVQFILAAGLLLIGLVQVAKSMRRDDTRGWFGRVMSVFLILFVLAVLLEKLSFVPSRHILFLAPIMYVVLAFGLERIVGSFRLSRPVSTGILGFCVAIGFYALHQRQADMQSVVHDIRPAEGTESVQIYDNSEDILQVLREQGYRAENLNPAKLEAGKSYHYVSNTATFDEAVERLQGPFSGFEFEKISEHSIVNNVYPIAFNPFKYGHTRPNNLHEAVFRVIKVGERVR